LGTPAWDLFDLQAYIPSAHRYRYSPVLPVMASRSCPFACDFCPQSLFHASDVYSARPAEDILHEILELREKYNVQHIEFYDPTFGINKEITLELLERLKNLNPPLAWSCYSRSDLLDRTMLQKMAEAGCQSILFGVESGDEAVLKRTQKDLDLEQVNRMVRECKEFGISTIASFIMGLPLDSKESLNQTIDYACRLNPTYAQFHQARDFFSHRSWKELGTVDDNWKEMASSINGLAYIPNGMTQKELSRLLAKAYIKFYLSPSKLRLFRKELRSSQDLHRYWKGIKQMTRYVVQQG